MDFTIEVSSKGKPIILYKNFKFRESHTLKSGSISWRCLGRDCKASIKTNADKTSVTEVSLKHTGRHPVTLRSLTPNQRSPALSSASSTSRPSTPNKTSSGDTDISLPPSLSLSQLISTPHTLRSHTSKLPALQPTPKFESPTPSFDVQTCNPTAPDIAHQCQNNTILEENATLKIETNSLRQQVKELLDHSIESDTRLLQFTDKIFVANLETPTHNDKTQLCPKTLSNQTEGYGEEVNKLFMKLREENKLLLEKYNILDEESKSMISTIRILEEEIKSKNAIIKDIEESLFQECEEKRGILNSYKTEAKSLLEYHKRYPKDSFKLLSQRLFTDLDMHLKLAKKYEAENKHLLEKLRQLNSPQTSELQNVSNYTLVSPPTTQNRFEILQSLLPEDPSFKVVTYHRTNKQKPQENLRYKTIKFKPALSNQIKKSQPLVPNPTTKINTHRTIPFKYVSVVGDSHARHLAGLMSERTSHRTMVDGVCKPGAGLLNIVTSSSSPSTHPNPDCVVLIAGTNDVAAGRQNIVFRNFERIIKDMRKSSRVLVCPLPPRYDLPPASPIHTVTSEVNNYIEELCVRNQGVELLNISSIGRKHFTAHGMHLRASGKILLAKLAVDALANCSPLPAPRRRHESNTSAKSPPRQVHLTQPYMLPYDSYAEAVRSDITTTRTPATSHSTPTTSYDGRNQSTSVNNIQIAEQCNISPTLFLGNPLLVPV